MFGQNSKFSKFPGWEDWLKNTADILRSTHGLESNFADDIAILLAYLQSMGLGPRITSGYRDGAKQAAMRARWDAGDRAGLRVRPAADSLHSATSWGKPAAKAIDIATSDDRRAAGVAVALKIGAGYFFSVPDPGHFYAK